MANLLDVKRFIRPEPDNTATFARKAVTDFDAIAARWGAIDSWRSVTTLPTRIVHDPRRTPLPSDVPWQRAATVIFNTTAQRWPAIERWQTPTTLPKRLVHDPRRTPLPDDAPWMRRAVVLSVWPPTADWKGEREPGPPRLDPRRAWAPDDTAWIRFATTQATPWAPVGDWRMERTWSELRPWPRWTPDDPWMRQAIPWPPVEAWDLERVRTARRAPAIGAPDDSAWIWFAATTFSAALYTAIADWRAARTAARPPGLFAPLDWILPQDFPTTPTTGAPPWVWRRTRRWRPR